MEPSELQRARTRLLQAWARAADGSPGGAPVRSGVLARRSGAPSMFRGRGSWPRNGLRPLPVTVSRCRNAVLVSNRAVTGRVGGGGGGPPGPAPASAAGAAGMSRIVLVILAPRTLRRRRRVVAGTSYRVPQQVIRGVDARHPGRESFLLRDVADRPVGMVLPGEVPPAALEILRGRATWHVEDPVRVAAEVRFGHPPRLPPRHPTRGRRAWTGIVGPCVCRCRHPWSPCSPSRPMACPQATAGCSSRNGMASGPSAFAMVTRCCSRAAT